MKITSFPSGMNTKDILSLTLLASRYNGVYYFADTENMIGHEEYQSPTETFDLNSK